MRCLLGLLAVSMAFAQAPARPRFEIATLKLSPPPKEDRININLGTFRNGRVKLDNVTLGDMIKFAYELVSDEQLVVPDWNRSVRFDVEALAPLRTPLSQVHLMTQDLLAERLHLVLRREQKTLKYLALTPGRTARKCARQSPSPIQTRGRRCPAGSSTMKCR